MKLIKYRDAGMPTFTYFWVNSEERCISPFFDTEREANAWLAEQQDQYDNWKPNKDIA